jgi:hypothetical protein
MRFSLILISFMVSIALVESFRWTAVRPNTRIHRLGVSEGSSAFGDMQPHPPNTPPPSDLLEETNIRPYFLSDRWDENNPRPAEALEGDADSQSDSQFSAMPQVEEEILPPYSALPAVVNTVTQEESPSVSDDIQAGIAVVSETIVTELIVSEVALRFWSGQQWQAGTHTRDNHRNRF